jgi:hypothetical protein
VVKSKETSAGKIWAVIILIIVVCIGTVVIAGAQFLFMLSSLFSGGINIQTSSNSPSVTQFQNDGNVTSPVSAFVPLSRGEYDVYLSKPVSGLDGESDFKSPHTYSGPALIAFDDFWGLNVALPIIPNLENPSGRISQDSNNQYVGIDLTSVISKNGKDILDHASTFEKGIFKILILSKKTSPIEYLSAHRQIHLITGATLSEVKTITGTLFFKIPLDSESSSNFYEKSYPFTINK